MLKITKGKKPKASNQNEPDQLAVAGTVAETNNLRTLTKAFAPVVVMRILEELKVNRRNARSHDDRQVQQIAASMREFGWLAPIVIDEDDTVLAGHAIHDICMDWRHMAEVMAAAKGVYSEQKNLCVWNKTNAGMGAFYRSKHELVLIFKVGTAPHINNFKLGGSGRYRTNVWDYAGVNTFKPGRMAELSLHPTVKPLPLVIDALKDCSSRRGIVLDPFVGSGTTLLAAEKTGRIGRGIELDPHYVDAAIGRWQTLTGQHAVHLESGRTFEEIPNAAPLVADAA
jgi:hypothetical protein